MYIKEGSGLESQGAMAAGSIFLAALLIYVLPHHYIGYQAYMGDWCLCIAMRYFSR